MFYFNTFVFTSDKMKDYTFLIELLTELQGYEMELKDKPTDVYAFATWLLQKRTALTELPGYELENKLDWNGKGRGGKAHYHASNLLTAISRYKMNYMRMALEGTPFDTYDEFAFMLSLVFKGDYTPSQLIERHIQLKPTGMEVIRRLLRKGLILQRPSETDKRSKLLSVTQEGRTSFYQALSKINAITDVVMAPLSEREQLLLLELLQKLDDAHREVFTYDKKLAIDGLLEKFNIGSLKGK